MNDKDLNAILQRLDALESKEAIRQLSIDYGIANDEHDVERLLALFTDDIAFESPRSNMVANGKDALRDMYVRTFKTRGPSFHWTHDITVTLNPENPDKATGLVLSHAETSPGETPSVAAMRYVDDYRREDGIWLFARREIRFLYYVPVTEYAERLTQRQRVKLGDTYHDADYPESLPPWIEFASTE